MKYASDFRADARASLEGKWTVAVAAGIIASLLGAVDAGGVELKLGWNENGLDVGAVFANREIFSAQTSLSPQVQGILVGGAAYIVLAGIVLAAALFILSSVVSVGYAKFNLDLIDRQQEPAFRTLFDYFKHWKDASAAKLLQVLYVLLWSLLLIIPGIIASYSYAMTGYILADKPQLTASEAIAYSKQLMSGNRWRLFCLQFSFIGWGLLAALTLGIGNLWLTPYQQAATAAFYREISDTAHGRIREDETYDL